MSEGTEYSQDEKREAFESWDRYIPRFKETIAKISRIPDIATGTTLLDNPLVSLIYADGFLNGRRSGANRQDEQMTRLMIENGRLVDVLRDCAAFVGVPEDHRPSSDDGLYALAVRIDLALAHSRQPAPLPDDGPCQCEECREERNRVL